MAKNKDRKEPKSSRENVKSNASASDFDRLAKEAENEQTRKPGSQSNRASKRNNNGRGGGK